MNNFNSFEKFVHLLLNVAHLNSATNYTENNKLSSIVTKQREEETMLPAHIFHIGTMRKRKVENTTIIIIHISEWLSNA